MTRKQKRLLSRIITGVILLIAALITEARLGDRLPLWQVLLLYLPAYLVAGLDVLKRAGQNILHGQIFDEGFLMALATLGALAVGFLPTGEAEFAEAVFVMIFYKTGTLFESIAVGKSRRSVSKLMDLRPQTARVLRNGTELEVSPEAVQVNELILVRPGERIPLDGTVVSGRSDLDTAALTGESLPLAVDVGARAVSGATNLTGALVLRVTSPFEDSTVQRILSLVQSAAARKARSEQFITRFARYYTPFVVICAILVAILPPLASESFSAAFPVWLTRALTFLVVSCPCALVISVPLTFFGSIGGAARHGILIKGGTYLEQLAKAQTVVLDKTGTLTKGFFTVSAIHPNGIDEAELLALAAAAEQHSNHPLAKAIAAAHKSTSRPAKNTREVAGRGVICEIDGKTVGVGNELLMRELDVVPEAVRERGTAVHVAREGRYLGYIVACDTVKPTASAAIKQLREAGVLQTVMLTGDREQTARAVAEELDLTEWHASLLPADKVTRLEALLAAPHRGTVLFVGDGINDAPVLSRADVGVAMGALGSDAAIEAADVVLMDDDLGKLALAIRHARRANRIVRQNITLTLAVKALALLGSALGLFGAWQMPVAIFADVGISVIAILNAMRTLKI